MMSAVVIKYNDDAFKWVLKFMQDEGIKDANGNLQV